MVDEYGTNKTLSIASGICRDCGLDFIAQPGESVDLCARCDESLSGNLAHDFANAVNKSQGVEGPQGMTDDDAEDIIAALRAAGFIVTR